MGGVLSLGTGKILNTFSSTAVWQNSCEPEWGNFCPTLDFDWGRGLPCYCPGAIGAFEKISLIYLCSLKLDALEHSQ
jgi:hypothetical protein